MANPLETLRKIKGRSWAEIRARGEQVFSVYAEQAGLSGKLPTDEELEKLLIYSDFNFGGNRCEDLLEKFYENGEQSFFQSFRRDEDIFELYKEKFGSRSTRVILENADKICEGKFDLLAFENLDFGAVVDWHFEPVSEKNSPLKHWKQFDEFSTDETGDKKIIWELNRHQHFFTLGMAYGLTGEERYAETFAGHLDSWMEHNPPGMGINWFSSLEVAFRAVSWIWAFHFFKSSAGLTAELFQKALKFLHLHGRHLERYLSTYYSPNTHLTGEALGLYYLGTQLPFFKRAAHWQKLGRDILFAELDRQILPDGGYFEQTTWYHRYTLDFYTHFLILNTLNNSKTEKFLLEKLIAKIKLMLNFLMYLNLPDGKTPKIGDDDGGRCLPLGNTAPNDFQACLSTGAALFDRGDYKFVAGDFAEETLWLLGRRGMERFDAVPVGRQPEKKSVGFEDSGYFVMRDGWGATDNYLLVDCGELGALKGGHGHADALAINLAVGGESLLVDAGTYTYHESVQLRDVFRTTGVHNTLLIDGKSQSEPAGKFSWVSRAEPRLKNWISEPRFDFFEGSHNGYKRLESSAKHTRSILYLKNDYWIMSDFVRTSGEHQYGLNFMFNAETHPKIKETETGGKFIEKFSAAGVGLRIFTFGDNGAWQSRNSFISPDYGKRTETKLMQYVSNGRGIQEFFTFLLPAEAGFSKPEVFETDVSGGRAFVIKYRDYIDLLVISDGEQIVKTEFFNTNFRFLWSRLSEIDSLPEEFILIGGRHFTLNGREIINYPNELRFASARRFGNQLNVRTSETVLSVSLPETV